MVRCRSIRRRKYKSVIGFRSVFALTFFLPGFSYVSLTRRKKYAGHFADVCDALQFLHRPKAEVTLSKLITSFPSPTALSFLSTASSDHELSLPTTKPLTSAEEATTETLNGFFVASENGVVLSRIGKGSWVCTAEGATGVLEG